MLTSLRAAGSVLFLASLRRLLGAPAIRSVGPVDARRIQLEEGAIIVDVREPHEWRAGHAPGAMHIPLGELDRKMSQLPKDRTVIVTCASGMRSRAGSRKLVRNGSTLVLNLSGGMNAWRAARLPIQK